MRLIGTLSSQLQAERLSRYLRFKKIASTCEVQFEAKDGQMSYQIWIHDEDLIDKAIDIMAQFQKFPESPEYDTMPEVDIAPPSDPVEPVEPARPRYFASYFTTFVIALCAFVYFFNSFEEAPPQSLTPLEEKLLFDLPAGEKAPYWHGVYDLLILKMKGEPAEGAAGPLFERIREGELWRLLSPIVLHGNILHILFNMLWLWVLGRPIEQRIGLFRVFLLSVVLAVGSNIVQYLVSGPFFLGYSGVVMGLAGFIWMRERIAPWEGYPLNRSTALFLLFFIGSLFVIQCVSFVLQIFTSVSFSPNIANAAHIAGAVLGAFLARFRFFAQRVSQ